MTPSTLSSPDDLPLVATHAQTLVAVDPKTGRLRWRQRLTTSPTRLFRIGPLLLVGDTAAKASEARLRCFDLATGAPLGEVALGFGIDTGLVDGDFLYVGGGSGFACLTPKGAVVWRALRVTEAGWLSGESSLVCTDAAGNELWRAKDPGPIYVGTGPGLLLGDRVAQPDVWGDSSRD